MWSRQRRQHHPKTKGKYVVTYVVLRRSVLVDGRSKRDFLWALPRNVDCRFSLETNAAVLGELGRELLLGSGAAFRPNPSAMNSGCPAHDSQGAVRDTFGRQANSAAMPWPGSNRRFRSGLPGGIPPSRTNAAARSQGLSPPARKDPLF
jgi:hypothetical protein